MENLSTKGDLAPFTKSQRLHVIDYSAKLYHSAINNDPKLLEHRISELELPTQKLLESIAQCNPRVKASIEAKYPPIRAEESDFFYVRRRLHEFPAPPHIISDLDGTITSFNAPTPPYERFFPANSLAEPIQLLDPNRINWVTTFITTWQPYLKEVPEVFEQAAEIAELRDGVNEFFYMSKTKGIPVTILSANMEPFVKGVLAKIEHARGIPHVAVSHNDISATRKDLWITKLALSKPNHPVIYIGDGSSDAITINVNSLVGCYFALKDSSFEKALKDHGLPHFTYTDFNEICNMVTKLGY